MKAIECEKCGSNELQELNNNHVCVYCRTVFAPDDKSDRNSESSISVHTDVAVLLEKCRSEPVNRRRYANLVLDLDPTNSEARAYLS